MIDRVVNLYHNLIDDSMIISSKNDNEHYKMISIDETKLELLKQEKQRLKKPIYIYDFISLFNAILFKSRASKCCIMSI